MSLVLRRLLRIRPEEVTFRRRRFQDLRDSVRARLEHVGEIFLQGYHAALADEGLRRLATHLEGIEQEFLGFAYEGASMALEILDQLTPWRTRRLPAFFAGPGEPHIYMVHVGVGWSLARLRFRLDHRLSQLDPLLRWLALDGFGFHEGYFRWARYADGKSLPKGLHGYQLRAFDQGLGRSLWFVAGADPESIARHMLVFPAARLGDLWSGIGLACAYGGGADAGKIERIFIAAGKYRRHLAQGAVFAAKTRERAGNPALHTELACRLLCGLSAGEAATIADRALPHALDGSGSEYELWRHRIRMHFSGTDEASQEVQIEHNGLVATRKKWDETGKGVANA